MKSIYCYQILILLAGCSNSVQQHKDPVPAHETFTIDSKQVGEVRTINIWTPPGYTKGTDSLPVLYMPDGGVEEDFPHLANTISALVQSQKIRPLILVGIENTQRRRDLTGPTQVAKDKEIAPVVGGSGQFRSFIREELIPEINKKYRTTGKRGIIGESLAGLFVTETFLLYPDMFDYYIAFDPSLWWNDKYLIKTAKEYLAKFPVTEKRFWFAGSAEEDIFADAGQLSEILNSYKLPHLQWKYSPEPDERHNTIFRTTKEKALAWTFAEPSTAMDRE